MSLLVQQIRLLTLSNDHLKNGIEIVFCNQFNTTLNSSTITVNYK